MGLNWAKFRLIPGGPKKQKQLNGSSHSTAFVFLDRPVPAKLRLKWVNLKLKQANLKVIWANSRDRINFRLISGSNGLT